MKHKPTGQKLTDILDVKFDSHPAERAELLAKQIESPDVEGNEKALANFTKRIEFLETQLGALLPIEIVARTKFTEEWRQLLGRSKELGLERDKFWSLLKISDSGARRLSLEPLTWRYPEGFPRLVLFPIAQSRFNFFVKNSTTVIIPEILPKPLTDKYLDVVKLLMKIRQQRQSIEVTYQFAGLLPDYTRLLIASAAKIFPNNVYLLVEASAPTLNGLTMIEEGQGLVVGYNYSVDQQALWTYGKFKIEPVPSSIPVDSRLEPV
jgi:hypothetical protein